MKRIPVKFQGMSLMPMKQTKAYYLVKTGKAKFRYDRKLNLWYLKLLVEPNGFATQEVTLGVDPGSTFDGFSVVSKKYHHLNVELIQRPKKGKNSIKFFKERQAMNRRIRRSRLRHRPIRFDNRISKKLPPTIKANIDFRKWLVTQLSKYFPITTIRVEDVKFNHYRDLVGKNRLSGVSRGRSFSLVEVGKLELYNWINDCGYNLQTIEGFSTSELRKQYLNGTDVKSLDKSEKSFNAHCLDSFIIASSNYNTDLVTLNLSTLFLEKIVKHRKSTLIRSKYKDAGKFFRYAKGGTKVFFEARSNKLNRFRFKPKGVHSNHPKEWIYGNYGYVLKSKTMTQKNSTVKNGVPKYFIKNEWVNRNIILSK
jgi:hypothetical protein